MRVHLGGFGNDGAVDVLDDDALGFGDLCDLLQDLEAADAFDAHVRGRKPIADVWLSERAEHSVGNRMAEHVRIRVAFQALMMRYFHTAEDEGAAFSIGVNIVSDSNAGSHVELVFRSFQCALDESWFSTAIDNSHYRN